jgi:serine/threonine protein phosphatase PrpC
MVEVIWNPLNPTAERQTMTGEYFESAEVTDVGRKRKNNEDACLRLPERGVYCVADGMGGQAGGDLASAAIITSIQQVFAKAGPEEDATFSLRVELFKKAVNQASRWINNFADEKVVGQMGSTIVALVIDPRNPARAITLHAGDSRLYRFRQGELCQITADHSAVAALAAKLGRTPESLPAKYQNELLRAVGLTESVELERTPLEVVSGDVYLICSDGLTKMQSDEQIAAILKAAANDPLATMAQKLIDAANEAGGKDNVTAVLVKAGDLSHAPNLVDSEVEDKTLAASTTQLPTEASAAPNQPELLAAMPDTTDVHGDTPQTDNITPATASTPTPITATDIPKTKAEVSPAGKIIHQSEKKKGESARPSLHRCEHSGGSIGNLVLGQFDDKNNQAGSDAPKPGRTTSAGHQSPAGVNPSQPARA